MPFEVVSLSEWLAASVPELLSIVIPAHNEEGHIADTVTGLSVALDAADIPHEIIIINDHSTDRTEAIISDLSDALPGRIRPMKNLGPPGFGFAVRTGLAQFRGGAVAICMADASDDPHDLIRFYQKLSDGYDCVFGSRFLREGNVANYPPLKLMLNRIGNFVIRSLFLQRYNDITNAFKLYRREVIAVVQPLLSHHFNLTVELPLKAIIRGYSFAVVPNSWTNRSVGVSKFKIREMGSRYLFIILYCLIEKWLSRGDYHTNQELREGQLQVWPR